MSKTAARKILRRAKAAALPARGARKPTRIADYPMHYFAAIQRQSQINLGHASAHAMASSVPMWRALSALHGKDGLTIGQIAEDHGALIAPVSGRALGRDGGSGFSSNASTCLTDRRGPY